VLLVIVGSKAEKHFHNLCNSLHMLEITKAANISNVNDLSGFIFGPLHASPATKHVRDRGAIAQLQV
jgi:hypothetical protein